MPALLFREWEKKKMKNRGQFTCQLQRSPSSWRCSVPHQKKATPPDYFPADNRTFAQALHKKNELKHCALSFMLHAVCPASVQLRRTAVGHGFILLIYLHILKRFDMTAQLQSTPRHLAFISLALGFLVIWTAVLAGVLVSRTLKDEASAKETTKVFYTHEDVGKVLFALGHELVSTVDWMLSTSDKTKVDNIVVTWKITNNMMSKIKEETGDRWVASVISMLDTLQERLTVFRETVSDVKSNPLSTVKFYLDLSDWVLQRCFLLDYAGQHLPVPSLPYTLFVRGMAQRFGELALGTIYVKSDMPINKSEFFKLRTGSEELMEASFHFTPRARTKWMELQEQEPGVQKVMEAVVEDILSGSSLRGQKELANNYLDGVKEQIAMLLLTKEVLNASLSSWVERLSQRSHNTLAFHMSIAIVAIVAVILCLIVTSCSCSYLSKGQPDVEKHNSQMPYSVLEKSVLSSNMKPQCYM
ncbi:uncharacterized protein TNCV_3118801 [Trichonephila clavipes]|uniref:Uncharacterized protein n=2 Tax=Trichonephila TaxID=2585208 RepID=A0A8X7BGR6_TRICX|nr:uncharacterized protein TNCV_3118801 [Trichonephila clavipes]